MEFGDDVYWVSEHTVLVILSADMEDIWYYEVPAEREIMHTACYL